MNNAWSRLLLSTVACAAIVVASGCGSDSDGGGDGGTNPPGFEVPAAYQGEWIQTLESTDCISATTPALMRETYVDTFSICPDEFDAVDLDDLGFLEIDCTESIAGNVISIDCEGTSNFFPGCDFSYDIEGTATFNAAGDSYTFVGRYEISSSGGCGEFSVNECETFTGTGTRISTTPEDCEDDGGGDGGGDDTIATISISGGSGPSSAEFSVAQGGANYFAGAGWTLGGSAILGATSLQVFAIGIDDGVETGTSLSLVEGGGEGDARFEFGELRNGISWELESFTGTLQLSTATASRLVGTFSGTGVMLSQNEDAENVTISGSFDSAVSQGEFRLAIDDLVRRSVRRAVAKGL